MTASSQTYPESSTLHSNLQPPKSIFKIPDLINNNSETEVILVYPMQILQIYTTVSDNRIWLDMYYAANEQTIEDSNLKN